ncbi:MAG TPA: xanthine dehydrogenase family protein subunit M [Bacteroidales bacterium]|nr:xanthine dehydrogenase family protein subunit M [Bacteroidales bacterium]
MPITHEFEYYKPDNWKEVTALLEKYKGKAKILAGGTDLLLKIKDDIETPEAIIDIKNIPNIDKIQLENNKLFIGAGVTFSQLINSEIIKSELYLLWEAAKTVASVGTRNRATIVGNICSAVPSLDSGPALLIYEAIINVISANGQRQIPISEWFVAPKKTNIKNNEAVVSIEINKPTKPNGTCYVKLGRYSGEDLAQAGIGIMISDNYSYKIALCALAPTPKRAHKIEYILNGNQLSENLINQAKQIISTEISPITDIRASKEYRLHMASVMLERGLNIALKRYNGEKIEPFNYLGG